jgi:ribosomal protein L15E
MKAAGEAGIMDPKEEDEFVRIRLHEEIERARVLIGKYEEGLAFVRLKIEKNRYRIGRLDERLGGAS